MRLFLLLLAAAFLSACGGGGGDDETTVPPHPDVALFFVSGHNPSGDAPYSYLSQAGNAGPEIVADLQATGLTVQPLYYIDDAYPSNGAGGYLQLVSDLRYARDHWAPYGTRVAVVAHSHGGVWAHAVIEAVDDLEITAFVDLDTSSYGWGVVGHDSQNSIIGHDPRNSFHIEQLTTCPGSESQPSEQTYDYDWEDVIFPNVRYALEVRSGEYAPAGDEWYDEKWNVRKDGRLDGLNCYFSGTDHSEVHTAGGPTVVFVSGWLKAHLSR